MNRYAAIVDYGLGNLFSVEQACLAVGLPAVVTADPSRIESAAAVILPGVGGFPDAMACLSERGLAELLRSMAAAGVPMMGICLGMQLLMSESHEFGVHAGLGLVPGTVRRLDRGEPPRSVKVPHVGWSDLVETREGASAGTLLDGVAFPAQMYFVHSFSVQPVDAVTTITKTTYGTNTFCSSLQHGRLFGCQFHPERSGRPGLRVYRNLMEMIGA